MRNILHTHIHTHTYTHTAADTMGGGINKQYRGYCSKVVQRLALQAPWLNYSQFLHLKFFLEFFVLIFHHPLYGGHVPNYSIHTNNPFVEVFHLLKFSGVLPISLI